MSYREKLIRFNSTEKYIRELDLVYALVSPRKPQLILDYGCGVGTAINYFSSISEAEYIGYDVTDYSGGASWYTEKIPKAVTTTYLNHSIAHIPNVENVMKDIRSMTMSKVVVNTPNREWIEKMSNPNYIPDDTVVEHFTVETLKDLMEGAGFRTITIGQHGEYHEGFNERIFYVGSVR